MSFGEGFQSGQTSLFDRRQGQRSIESALLNDTINRKVAEEQLIIKQQEAAATAEVLRQNKARADRLAGQLQGQPNIPGPGAPVQAPAGGAPPGAPTGPMPGATATGAPPAAPAQAPPMIQWLQKNQGMGEAYMNAIQTGDGETQRKIMGVYNDSVGSTKQSNLGREHSEAVQNGYNGTLAEWKQLGASSTTIVNPLEKAYDVQTGGDAAKRRGAVLNAGDRADKEIRGYSRMYGAVLSTANTGALADLRIGVRKLADYAGIGEEVADVMTGIKKDDIAAWEELRKYTMDRVMERIQDTKGAISEREMEAFANSVAGVRNTRRGNILILEGQMDELDQTRKKAEYVRKHVKIGGSPQDLENAEREWNKDRRENEDEWAEAWTLRADLIKETPDAAIGELARTRASPGARKEFMAEFGWLPRGMQGWDK